MSAFLDAVMGRPSSVGAPSRSAENSWSRVGW
jgi:hypothetical protein